MAKTIFQAGTYIMSNFLNSLFGGGAGHFWQANTAYSAGDIRKLSGGEVLRCIVAGISDSTTEPTAPGALRGTVTDNTVTWELFGGHLHDGKAMDGSAPKIVPAEIVGYSEGTFNLVFNGPGTYQMFTVEQTAICYYRKHTPASGPAIVELSIPAVSGTSNSTILQSASTQVPVAIRPKVVVYLNVHVFDNGSETRLGTICIDNGGNVTVMMNATVSGDADSLLKGETAPNFTASGTKGFKQIDLRYAIWP